MAFDFNALIADTTMGYNGYYCYYWWRDTLHHRSFVQQFMSGDAPGSADIETLKAENAELKAENEKLKAENAALKAGGGDAE